MAFLDQLKDYLEGIGQARPAFVPDVAAHRRHLLSALEELERRGKPEIDVRWHQSYWAWRLEPFASELGRLLLEGFAKGLPVDEISALINVSLSRALGLDVTAGSAVKDRELDRLRKLAAQAVTGTKEPEFDFARYAHEIRAVARAGEHWTLTPIGKLLVDLPARDAVRWLLTVEAVQSRGSKDEWRLSRSSAAELLRSSDGTIYEDQHLGAPVASATLRRLSSLEILAYDRYIGGGLTEFEIRPEGRPLLEEVASGADTPLSVLAEALLQDETSAVLGKVRPVVTRIQSDGAAAATTRHARMVVHEVRNALVPVRGALDDLYRDVERSGAGAALASHQDAIDGGIDRIFRFLRDMLNVAALGAEPAEPFDVAPAIEEALAAVAEEFGARMSFPKSGPLPPVVGHRRRFTLAIVNMLRNAAQAPSGASAEVRVTAEAAAGGNELLILVDDSGPGVPSEHREAIFRRGFSMRPGGTGEGLALVREVVEQEMHGQARCEESPLGGARFRLRIPVRQRVDQ
ncbi:HAMP domain-containing sensor histidine kinase [Sorangium sp. So ce185]|uniref:sensor histidine kinase n=1 Tax=Sorangium sp. So ce185 TaxID=3133287 RepID=UPI003F626AFC